jgi:hypothetical protein
MNDAIGSANRFLSGPFQFWRSNRSIQGDRDAVNNILWLDLMTAQYIAEQPGTPLSIAPGCDK